MWIFEQLKKQKEQNENLALKRQLLEKYKTWEISKHEYECALMDMQLSQEEKEFNKIFLLLILSLHGINRKLLNFVFRIVVCSMTVTPAICFRIFKELISLSYLL
mgnify:CR=1 FL=1